MSSKPVIFCALDTPDLKQACDLASQVGPVTGALKIGLEFFNAHGPQGIEKIAKSASDAALFIDLKYHDIPNTVAGAVRSICAHFEPAYLNVHAAGGLEMMRAAKQACSKKTKLLGVTVLTSLDEEAIEQVGFRGGISARVEQFAMLAKQAGLDGVVNSAHEIKLLRDSCGPAFVLMVPGIRPDGIPAGDQKRVMTPKQGITAGATHLVIGRPITAASDPAAAAQKILDDLKKE
jgi:orotidine-5'-phosphate decarboxylase